MKKTKDNKEQELHTEYGMWSNTRYILRKIKQYYPLLLLMMAITIVTSSFMKYMWSFIGKYVVDLVEQQASLPTKDIVPLLQLLAVVLVIEVVSLSLSTLTNNRQWYCFIHVRMHLITERIAKVLTMNYQMLEKPDILDMCEKADRATGGNNEGVEGLMYSLNNLGIQFLTVCVTLSTVAVLDWRLIIVLSITTVFQFLFYKYTAKKDKKEVWDMLSPTWRKINYMQRTTQDFDYAKDIRLFGMKEWLSQKQHDIFMEKQNRIMYHNKLWLRNKVFGNTVSIFSNAAVYGVLIFSVLGKGVSIGDFTLYLGLAGTFSTALRELLIAIGEHKRISMQVDDFRTFMDFKVEEEGDFLPIPKSDQYTFEFRNVSFKYDKAEDYALKNLNLTLEPGKRLAVVGLNGAGKTTFIKLLLRLYDVTEGEILLNGIDVRRFRRDEYYQMFAPVFQNVEIFAFPMCENVSMKRPEETDKERAYRCLEQAGMKEKIESLTQGIDTQLLKVIYDDGVDLSGGEKQKVSLAKALYKDAPIIVLDEPTAALDALAEYHLYKNFDEMIGNKTAVYISHRLSSTRFCDDIVMFKAGEMVEHGTHETLLAKKGAYAEMFEVQAQYYKEGKEYGDIAG